METKTLQQMKQWVETWQRAGIELEYLRQQEMREISTTQALLNLSGAFESCRLHLPLRTSSGLVEQQAWFKKYGALKSQHD